jgi:hypothetical protein
MQRLEVSGAIRPLKWPLGVKGLNRWLDSAWRQHLVWVGFLPTVVTRILPSFYLIHPKMGRPTGLHFHGKLYEHPHIVKMQQKTGDLNTKFLNSKCVIYTLTPQTGFYFCTIYYRMLKKLHTVVNDHKWQSANHCHTLPTENWWP